MAKKEKSAFSQYFKEDAEIVRSIIDGESRPDITEKVGPATNGVVPKISHAKPAKNEEVKAYWRSLRAFFRSGNNTGGLPNDLAPALMAPIYTNTMVGSDFPVWVADENFDGSGEFCLSLKEIIADCLEQIGPEKEEAHILKENMERIIHLANDHLSDHKPKLAQPSLDQILNDLEKLLDVSGDEALPFKNDLKNLRVALPKDGVLLPYTSNTSLQLLETAMMATLGQARISLREDIRKLKGGLKDLLQVERDKVPEGNDPGKLQDSMDFAGSMVNFDELSSMLPQTGSEIMDESRIQRIATVVKELEETASLFDQQCLLFVDEIFYNTKNIDWENLLGTSDVKVFKQGKGCDAIKSAFELHIEAWTKLFSAKRIGDLELENLYQPEIHEEFFQHFNWQSFSEEELNNCPYFIMIADDVHLFDAEFRKLSAMLSDNIPVKILAIKREESITPDQIKESNSGSAWHANTELGALMLSYKNIYIAQATAITPKYLFNRFKEGLTAFAPAFFYLLNIDRTVHEDSYLWTSACVESRDFPGFTFRGMLGTPWGSRFEVVNNPQPDKNWPVHELTVLNEEGVKTKLQIPFTFTDWAVLNPVYSQLFMHVEACFWNDDLIPLTNYMENSISQNIGKVPFIWMMDSSNELHKIAVSWPMVIASQERLDFWRFLQENSGINNYHVTRAVEETRLEMQEQHLKDIKALKEEQLVENQKIRDEEAGLVMENLTSALLGLDTSNVFSSGPPLSDTPVSKTSSKGEKEEEESSIDEKAEEDEITLSNDPYIDTALCTACDECTELNDKMFKYNADKLAYIADPNAGTFSDLVEAAEICPVSIIHPGSPLDPNEANLDDLVERAQKFN